MLKLTPKKRVLFVRRLTPVMLAVFGVFSISLTFIHSPKLAYAATSNTINFQARLQTHNGGIVPDGDYNVEFKLYKASGSTNTPDQGACTMYNGSSHIADPACLWVETRTSGNKVHVTNGYLSVQLGSVNAFSSIDWTQNLWLTMNIGGTGTASWDGEMDPRLPLTAVPYAFAAGQLQTTNGNGTNTLSIQGSSSGNQSFVIQSQGSAGTYNILTAPDGTDYIDGAGNLHIKASNDAGVSLHVQSAVGGTDLFMVDNSTGTTLVQGLQTQGSGSININNGTLRIGGSSTTPFRSPGTNGDGSNGADIPTKINVPIFDPGAFGQIIALGLPSANCTGGTTTSCSARAITVLDARTLVHQPSINLLDVGEDQVFGLSWDGANCNSDPNCVALLKTSASRVGLQSAGVTGAQLYTDSTTSNFIIGASGSRTGLVTLQNSSNSNTVSIKSGTVSTSYTILLPTNVGSTSQCLSVSGVSSQVETLAHSGCFTQGGSSFGAAANLGTADSNVLNLVTNGSTQATIAVGGATTFKNSTDSTNAFQIQNNSGASLFNADTVNNTITLGPSTNLETTGDINNPSGGIGHYQNLLLYSEQLDHDTGSNKWDNNNVSGPATSIHPDWSTANPAPDGSGTADLVGTVSGGGWLSQATATAATNDSYTFSFWAKSTGGTQSIEAAIDGTGSGAGTIKSFVATPNWQRFSVTQDTTNFTGNLRVTIYPGTTGGSGSIGVWGAQLVKGTTPQVYVRTTSAPIGVSQGVVSNGSVYANGSGLFTTGSTTAFQVQNASGAGVFTVDTSGGNVNLGSNVNLILSGSGAHISNPQGRTNSEAFGAGASVLGNYAVAVGNAASAGTADGGVAIGYNASTYSYGGSIAIGNGASARDYSVVIGAAASVDSVDGQNSVSIGTGSSAVLEGVTIGNGASSQSSSIAIGYGADASGGHSSIALGHQAAVTGWNQLVIGSSSSPIYNAYIGNGVTNASPAGFTLQATSTTVGTTNTAGASISIAGGQGTGTAAGGNINFQIAKSGVSTGSSQNALATVAGISGATGAATFQNSSNSTTAFQVQNTAGASLFNVDTSAQVVTVGPSGGDSTGTVLVLGTKTGSASDPTGVNGAMYYNATLAEFRCYADGVWTSCMANARTSYHYTNEMLSDISDDSLEFNHAGNGGSGYIDGETGHPGIAQIGTGTTTPGTVWSYAGMVGRSTLLLGNGDYWRYETVLRLSTAGGGLSNGTDRYRVEAGFNDDAASDGVDGCYFKYSDNNNSGKWQGVCRSNSTESTCDVGITVAVDTWYRLTVVVNSAGDSTDFQVNGVSKCQVTTNIPTGAGRNTRWGDQIIKDSGSSNRYIDLDYVDVQAQFGTSR